MCMADIVPSMDSLSERLIIWQSRQLDLYETTVEVLRCRKRISEFSKNVRRVLVAPQAL